MSFTAAASGFLVFLLSVQVIQGQDDWGVTYTSPQICALKGTTVEIRCSYRYPSRLNDGDTTAERTFWIADRRPVDLRLDSNYAGRVQHHCDKRDCTLRIRDVRESDSAVYKLRFITQSNSYTGSPGVRLTVTGFWVQMSRTQSCGVGACTYAELNCHSSCPLTDRPSYIWYKNGQKMDKVEKPFYHYVYPEDSYSCAVRGHEDVPSRSVCVHGQSCNRVTYDDRNICAFKGSTVYIYCTYNSYESIRTKFWFRFDQSGYNTRPKDLSKDPQYAGRVKVFENERGGFSTLSISDLRERDSAEYHFKVTTGNYEWESSLPGTTLTVTDPDLQVQVIWSPDAPKLICHSSCLLVGRSSFVWYKNDTIILGETSFSYGGKVDPADSYSCAHEGHRSPSVYAPKRPSVSVSPSEIEEGSSVTLSCSSDANPAAKYSWYKENQTLLSKKPQLVFSSIQSSDSGEYYCAAENELGRRTSTYVFVNVKYAPRRPSVSVSPSAEIEEGSSVTLNCSSDANPAANYTWYKENQTLVHGPDGIYHFDSISSEDRGIYHCKSENQYGLFNSSPLVINVLHAPKRPSVSVSPSAEIEEGSSVTLSCSSDANPAANYTWYKENQTLLSKKPQLVLSSIQSSDSGEYYCAAENELGRRTSTYVFVNVKYAPRRPSVSVSPSEIEEGSSVTLTCSSDANPAANYTWYKENQTLLSKKPQLVFSSIQSSDSGEYYCAAENELGRRTSTYVFVNVKYAPKRPSVSVSPSEIEEGSSVTLTCSSDANPAAKYTWYKEDEDSPKASGQIFTITDFRAEHSGNYYCEAENNRGRRNSTLHLITVADKSTMIMNFIRLTLVFVMMILMLLSCLLMRKKKTQSSTAETNDAKETLEMESFPDYINFSDLKTITAEHTEDTEEQEELV